MSLQLVAQVVGGGVAALGGIGGIVAWFKMRSETRKLNADATAVINDAASRAVQRAENELARMGTKVKQIEIDLDRSTGKIRGLESQVDILTGRLRQATHALEQNHIPLPWAPEVT